MKPNSSWHSRVAQILLGSAIVLALFAPRGTFAQGRDDQGQDLKKGWDGKAPESQPVHLTTDWSHRHVVFSAPKNLMQQFQLSGNVRYVQQLVRRNAEKKGGPNEWRWRRAPESPKLLHGDWSLDMGSGAKVGAGNYPAKYSFDTTSATCAELNGTLLPSPDFVVYNTSLAGSSTQATIAAFTNLYVGTCSNVTIDAPNLYWAYNTGTTGAIVTSVVLSGDGNQVAIVQNTATASTLVLLKWVVYDGSLTGPTTLANQPSAAAYRTCSAPCMYTIPFSLANGGTAALDTHSSPFYDYAPGHDTLYVGNNDGRLHKFTGVFAGNPVETVTAAWPATLNSGGTLTSPVYDEGNGQVFVGSSNRHLYRVDGTTGAVVASGLLGSSGINDSPILDSSTENVYVFVRGDNGAGTAKSAGVYQFGTGFLAGTTGVEVKVTSNTILPATAFYAGDFDNFYYTSAGGTGSMYVCSTNAGITALWQITVTGGALSAPTPGPTLTTINQPCSPVAEFYDGTTDWMFVSVTGSSLVNDGIVNCPAPSGGCLISYDITDPTTWSTTTPSNGTASAASGASGVVVDNSSPVTGASQVYFTPLANQTCTTSGGTGGCAIQASQSALQ